MTLVVRVLLKDVGVFVLPVVVVMDLDHRSVWILFGWYGGTGVEVAGKQVQDEPGGQERRQPPSEA